MNRQVMKYKDQHNSMSEFDLLVAINASLGLLLAEAVAQACEDLDLTSDSATTGAEGRAAAKVLLKTPAHPELIIAGL